MHRNDKQFKKQTLAIHPCDSLKLTFSVRLTYMYTTEIRAVVVYAEAAARNTYKVSHKESQAAQHPFLRVDVA